MLIPLDKIKEKYRLNIKNILHVGAHNAEEKEMYESVGCKKVIWVEANPFLVENLKNNLESEKHIIHHAVVSEKDGEDISLMITNNGQSSSILELGKHKELFPGVYVNKQMSFLSKTLKTLFVENNYSFLNIDFLNLDIQGAELMALKGIGDGINHINAIYTEINTDYVYKDCALVSEIDDYLSVYGFKRVETVMWNNHPWGDALYIRE